MSKYIYAYESYYVISKQCLPPTYFIILDVMPCCVNSHLSLPVIPPPSLKV